MLVYIATIAASMLLMLGVCVVDGDFSEGGLFADLVDRVKRTKHRSVKP
jgi:hypothetical protein